MTPNFPAPTALRLLTISSIISAFTELLFKASSGKTQVGFENLNTFSIFHRDKNNRTSLFRESMGSGTGASFNRDGVSSILPLSGTGRISIEITENRYPLHIVREELIIDSGGPGKYRGGLGVTKEFLLKEDSHISLVRNADDMCAVGRLGGQNGSKSEQLTFKKGARKNSFPSIVSLKKIDAGEFVIVGASGGGGYGNPLKRNVESVKDDVLRGFVSRSAALKLYGVVFKNNQNLEVDEKLTKKERNQSNRKKK